MKGMARIRSLSTFLLCWLIGASVRSVLSEEAIVTDSILDADPLDPIPGDSDEEVIVLDDILDNIVDLPDVASTDNSTLSKDVADEAVEQAQNTKPELVVESSLEAMSDEELKAICTDRGFEITMEGEGGLLAMTHADYVEAATKCLSLEKEMNAVLAENPELAAELDVEIERMRAEKERLEQEREAILAEKARLEEQLRQSGVDPSTIVAVPESTISGNTSAVDEVLRESFVRLFDRVGCDLQLVGGLLLYVLKPMGGPIQQLWRYTSPSVEGLLRQFILVASSTLGGSQWNQIRQVVLIQSRTIMKVSTPIMAPFVSGLASILRLLNQKPEIQQVRRILGAFFGPLTESLYSGWTLVEPNVTIAVQTTKSWLQGLTINDPPQVAQ